MIDMIVRYNFNNNVTCSRSLNVYKMLIFLLFKTLAPKKKGLMGDLIKLYIFYITIFYVAAEEIPRWVPPWGE